MPTNILSTVSCIPGRMQEQNSHFRHSFAPTVSKATASYLPPPPVFPPRVAGSGSPRHSFKTLKLPRRSNVLYRFTPVTAALVRSPISTWERTGFSSRLHRSSCRARISTARDGLGDGLTGSGELNGVRINGGSELVNIQGYLEENDELENDEIGEDEEYEIWDEDEDEEDWDEDDEDEEGDEALDEEEDAEDEEGDIEEDWEEDEDADVATEHEEIEDDEWDEEDGDYDDELDSELAMELEELLSKAELRVLEQSPSDAEEPTLVHGIANDSRRVHPGDLFVCVRGSKNGHDYAVQAEAAGAAVIVIDENCEDLQLRPETTVVRVPDTNFAIQQLSKVFYGDPSLDMTVVGITGTNGKTTTSYLVRGIIESLGKKSGLIGTVAYEAGDVKLTADGLPWEGSQGLDIDLDDMDEDFEAADALMEKPKGILWSEDQAICSDAYLGSEFSPEANNVYSVPNTTPDALQCQMLFSGMLGSGVEGVAMEVSSHALAQGRTGGVDFDIAVFTNLSRDHLDYHTTFEEYREAKLKLFRALDDPERQRAVINLDDPNAEYFIEAASKVPIITYGIQNDSADCSVELFQLTLTETPVQIRSPKGEINIISSMLGKHNLYNIVCAAAVGIALDAEPEAIAEGVESVEGVPGRFEHINEDQNYGVIVDYAHTPDAMQRVLEAAREIATHRVICVFGAGGDRDRGKRAEMGAIAYDMADVCIVTNDNPRKEDPRQIISDILSGFPAQFHTMGYSSWIDKPRQEWRQDYRHTSMKYNGNFDMEPLFRQSVQSRYIIEDRRMAIIDAIAMADKGDVVCILGKGHEKYLEFAMELVPIDPVQGEESDAAAEGEQVGGSEAEEAEERDEALPLALPSEELMAEHGQPPQRVEQRVEHPLEALSAEEIEEFMADLGVPVKIDGEQWGWLGDDEDGEEEEEEDDDESWDTEEDEVKAMAKATPKLEVGWVSADGPAGEWAARVGPWEEEHWELEKLRMRALNEGRYSLPRGSGEEGAAAKQTDFPAIYRKTNLPQGLYKFRVGWDDQQIARDILGKIMGIHNAGVDTRYLPWHAVE